MFNINLKSGVEFYIVTGVVVYEIIDGGRFLSGICANNDTATIPKYGRISSDIATLQSGSLDSSAIYTMRAMEGHLKKTLNGTLTITLGQDNVYDFVWKDENGCDVWIGIGFKAGENRFAVSYSHPRIPCPNPPASC